jgi:chemotaxis protein methyltransferase CheR
MSPENLETENTPNELSPADFERVREMIYRHAGISLNPSKRTMVYSRLSRRLRALGKPSFCSYLDDLNAARSDANEWQEFVNALTTNLTSFFREQHHFPVLSQHIQQCARHGPVKLWCCAASTGEEPYTMAITAMDALKSRKPAVSLLATDIDTAVLDKARSGIYSDKVTEKLDAGLMQRHFLRGRGKEEGMVRVRPDLVAMIEFRQLNLLSARWPMDTKFDAIFCRNVMIYFDKPTQRLVLERLAARLKPGGLFFAGHSENFTQSRDLFELQGKTVYRLAGAGH